KRVEWCISKRCELLKLNPPQRLEHGGSTEMPPIRTELQPELTRAQRFVRIAALLADGGIVQPDAQDRDRSDKTPPPLSGGAGARPPSSRRRDLRTGPGDTGKRGIRKAGDILNRCRVYDLGASHAGAARHGWS